eukprot:Skav208370  [mRNA]  locus=scaffold1964:684062:692295:- [translate_table: standard]
MGTSEIDPEPLGMEAVLHLARQCGQQQKVLKLNSLRQEEMLTELEVMLMAVNERVTVASSSPGGFVHDARGLGSVGALRRHKDVNRRETAESVASGAAVAKLRRGNSASVESMTSSYSRTSKVMD